MEKIPNFEKTSRLKVWAQRLALSLLMSGSLAHAQEGIESPLPAEQVALLVEQPAVEPVWVTTKDGLIRWYYNPQTTAYNVRYAVGATQSPYKNEAELFRSVRVPLSLTETDFYTNYLSALGRSDTILFDEVTGQPYQNPTSFEGYVAEKNWNIYLGVPYQRKGEQWNVHRFLIEPHFGGPDISIKDARKNAEFDMFRYFLWETKGDRVAAESKTQTFMHDYVDRVVASDFASWWRGAKAKLMSRGASDSYEITSAIKPEMVLDQLLDFNKTRTEDLFSRAEVLSALTSYFEAYERLSEEEAAEEAASVLQKKEAEIRDQYQRTLDMRPRPGKSDLPEGFGGWDPALQQQHLDEHPNALISEITEEDILTAQEDLQSYRWQEGPIVR